MKSYDHTIRYTVDKPEVVTTEMLDPIEYAYQANGTSSSPFPSRNSPRSAP